MLEIFAHGLVVAEGLVVLGAADANVKRERPPRIEFHLEDFIVDEDKGEKRLY